MTSCRAVGISLEAGPRHSGEMQDVLVEIVEVAVGAARIRPRRQR
jgi:hypothetical protein